MSTAVTPDALPPELRTSARYGNRAVIAEEAVTSIASPPAALAPVDIRSLALTVLAVLVVNFVLHWARAFFIQLMLGVMISYAFSPIVNRMQKWRIPRAIGAAVFVDRYRGRNRSSRLASPKALVVIWSAHGC